MDVATTAPADSLSMDDFFAQGNALERGTPAPEVVAEPVAAEPVAVDEPPAGMERDAAGKFVAKTKDAPVEKVKKPRDDPEARINQAIARQREAERRAEAAEARLAAQPAPKVEPAKVEEPKPIGDPEPQEADFADYRQFVKAQARWEARQEIDQRESARIERERQQRDEHETRTLNETWFTRLNDAKAKDPDRINAIDPKTPMSQPMMHAVKVSPVGVELLHYLSEHQDESQRLSTLHPQDALREMGKLEGRLEAASSRPAPVIPDVSNAKAPLKRLESTPVNAADGPPDDSASVDEHIKFYNAEERRKAKR